MSRRTKLLIAFAALLAVGAAVAVPVLVVFQREFLKAFADPVVAEVRSDADDHLDLWLADVDDLSKKRFFTRSRPARDVGPYLNPRLPWTAGVDVLGEWRANNPLPPDERITVPSEAERLVDGFPAISDIDAAVTAARELDTSWIEKARDAGWWNLRPGGPLEERLHTPFAVGPVPDYMALDPLIKLYLLRARADGALLAALEDVRHLAWLALTNETDVGVLVCARWLKLADDAADAWEASPEAKASVSWRRVRGVGTASVGFFRGVVDEAVMGRAVRGSRALPLVCAGLTENATMELSMSPILDERFEAGHARLRQIVRNGVDGCRLAVARAAIKQYDPAEWGVSDAYGPFAKLGTDDMSVPLLLRLARLLPGGAKTAGVTMWVTTVRKSFGWYEKKVAPNNAQTQNAKPR